MWPIKNEGGSGIRFEFLCLSALVNRGENILTPSPDYPLYSAVLAKLGIELNTYDLNEEDGWQPDLADIKRKITPRTRAIVLINPNNPTGSVCSRNMLEKLAEIARRHNLLVLTDEIYDQILYDGAVHYCAAALATDLPVLTFGGMSKTYRLAGFRSGWLVVSGPREPLAEYREGLELLANMRMCPNVPAQHAIPAALDGGIDITPLMRPGGRPC